MENQKISPKPVILNYGVILGISIVLLSVILYVIDGVNMNPPFWQKALGYLLSIVIIIFAIKKFREINSNILSLGQALKIGVGVALISAIIFSIYSYIFMNFIEPGMIELMLENAEETILQRNPEASDEEIEMGMKITKMIGNPLILTAILIVSKIFTGLIVSLIGGLIMKKEEEIYS